MLQQFAAPVWVRLVEHLDGPLLLITALIMATGLATVYSATYDASNRLLAQAAEHGGGLLCDVAGGAVATAEADALRRAALRARRDPADLVFFFGVKVNGARRWLSLGFTRIQPSEVLKIAVPLMLAWYFHKHEAVLNSAITFACLLLLVPFALIAKQPDLGTAILVGAAGFYVIFLAGLPWQVIVGLFAAAGGGGTFRVDDAA
jgi:rod shape determining protein RodA